jgi:hypothetical protein
VPQLEELTLQIPMSRPITPGGHDLRRLRELHSVRLQAAVSHNELLALADLPALRTLDLGGLRFNWMQISADELAEWRKTVAELRKRRKDIDIIPPHLPTDEDLRRWQTPQDPVRVLRSRQRFQPAPQLNSPPTFQPETEQGDG